MSHRLLTFFCAILSASSLCASAAAEGPIAIKYNERGLARIPMNMYLPCYSISTPVSKV